MAASWFLETALNEKPPGFWVKYRSAATETFWENFYRLSPFAKGFGATAVEHGVINSAPGLSLLIFET